METNIRIDTGKYVTLKKIIQVGKVLYLEMMDDDILVYNLNRILS